ncbi:MAG: hypothetical protein AB2705_15665 [Candidatus Thiodiazotropha sp.]
MGNSSHSDIPARRMTGPHGQLIGRCGLTRQPQSRRPGPVKQGICGDRGGAPSRPSGGPRQASARRSSGFFSIGTVFA